MTDRTIQLVFVVGANKKQRERVRSERARFKLYTFGVGLCFELEIFLSNLVPTNAS